MDEDDELTEFERLILTEGVHTGSVKVTLMKAGKPVDEAQAIKRQVDQMVLDGFLTRGTLTGGTSRYSLSDRVATYYVTRAGRVALTTRRSG